MERRDDEEREEREIPQPVGWLVVDVRPCAVPGAGSRKEIFVGESIAVILVPAEVFDRRELCLSQSSPTSNKTMKARETTGKVEKDE